MIRKAIERLTEREKELKCIYEVEELLKNEDEDTNLIFKKLLQTIPRAWQYSTICEVKIVFEDKVYTTEDFKESDWWMSSDIIVDNNILGEIRVYYTQFIRLTNNSQFLPEEQKLLNTIAEHIANYFFHKKLKQTIHYLQSSVENNFEEDDDILLLNKSDQHSVWRLKIAHKIANKTNYTLYGVVNMYIIGSVKNFEAGPASDIDLLVHLNGTNEQQNCFKAWIEGWSLCLSEINFIKTGYETNGLIDLHVITDEDIKNQTSYGCMINSNYNSAKLLR